MGGRSRKPNFPDRWDWLKELSDNRLDNYGKMSAAKYRENYTDRAKSTLHMEAAAEYERRHGSKPAWHYNPHAESVPLSQPSATFSTSRLQSGREYVYNGGLNDMHLTFHSKDNDGKTANRLWYFKDQDGGFVSLTARQVNKNVRNK